MAKKKSYYEWMKENYGHYNEYEEKVSVINAQKEAERKADEAAKAEAAKAEAAAKAKTEERTWFKGSNLFDDGYQMWDVSKTVLGTLTDAAEWAGTGLVGMGEKFWDGLMALGTNMAANDLREYAYMNDLDPNEVVEEAKEETAEYIKKDLYDEHAFVANKIINPTESFLGLDPEGGYSVLGEKSQGVLQSGGQLLGTVALQGVGVPWFVTTGVTSYGGEVESALKDGGASWEEANISGFITAGSDILTEKISGGIRFGGKTLDDILTRQLATKISDKFVRTALKLGLDVGGEAGEEWLATDISKFGQWLTYRSDEELNELLFSEEAMDEKIEAAIGGALLGGVSSAGKAVVSNAKGVDYVTELTKNEQKVIDAEYNKRIAEAEKGGKKLSQKEKNEIYTDVFTELERGEISTSTIEKVLGGEDYSRYTKETERQKNIQKELKELENSETELTEEQQDRLWELKAMQPNTEMVNTLKASMEGKIRNALSSEGKLLEGKDRGSYLNESFAQEAKSKTGFKVNLNEYEGKQKELLQGLIENGDINDTRIAHDFWIPATKAAADSGINLTSTTTEKIFEMESKRHGEEWVNKNADKLIAKYGESWFNEHREELVKKNGDKWVKKNFDGITPNAFIMDDGTLAINVKSRKAREVTFGHEIGHRIKQVDSKNNTNNFGELSQRLVAFAEKVEGDAFKQRKATLEKLYSNGKGDVNEELTNDLIGEYVFGDKNADFIKTLSVENKNLFQRLWDEIKYLYKLATAGSKEKRELEKIKKLFNDIYRESANAKTESKGEAANYSLSEIDNAQDLVYNGKRGDSYVATDEFRSLQAESQRMSDEEWNFYLRGGKNEVVRRRISAVFQRQMDSWRSSGGSNNGVLKQTAKGNQFNIYEDVDGSLFHDVFEVARKYLKNGELVDLHGIKTTKDGIGYNDCVNYLSDDGLSGFSITPDGDLISVFNASDKAVFLRAISDIVKSKAKTLDCYISPEQNLMEMYSRTFGFKTASVMDYNMKYDHDNIAQNHNNPQIAFMVNSDADIETRAFTKDEYDEAVTYRNSFMNQATDNKVASFMPQNSADDAIEPTKYSLSEDSKGRDVGDAVQNRFAKTKVLDENGRLKVVYHGTASGEFTIFDKAKGSVEGDFGSGFYFTDNEYDVSEHYEGGGPDFENKVGRRADQIWNENPDLSYEEAEERAYKELYQGSHKFEVYLNIENPAIVGETNLFTQDSYFEEYNRDDYDNEDDYYADVEQLVADDIDNVIWEIERNVDVNSTDGIAEILWEAFNEGGIDIETLKSKINNLYLEDSEGNFVGNEVARQIIESLGYDGIIDPTVSGKWNMEMEEGTTHYIVFKPNQIKSVTNQNPTDNPDINYSLSFSNEPIQKGSMLETALVREESVEDIAPIREDLQTAADDIAPLYDVPASEPTSIDLRNEQDRIRKEMETAQANGDMETFNRLAAEGMALDEKIAKAEADEAAWHSDSLASLGDIDAPVEEETEYYNLPDTTPLPKTKVSEIAKAVKNTLGLSKEYTGDIRNLIEEYSTSEFSTREDLEQKIRDIVGDTLTFSEEAPGVKEVQTRLRETGLKVSQTIKNDIADYNSVRLSHFRKIGFNKNGLDVDTAYQELTEMFPDFFPADITNPTDQFLRMVDVSDMSRTLDTEYEVDNETISEMADIIIEGVNSYKQAYGQRMAEKQAKSIPLPDFAPDEDIAPLAEDIAPVADVAIKPKREAKQSNEPRMIRADSNNGRTGEKQRKWVKTSTGSEAVDGKVLPDDLNQNTIHYQPISNKKTLGNANAKLGNMGYDTAVSYFNSQFANKKISLDDVALGERLIQEAVKRGDTKTAGELIQNVAILGTELGQKVQALSIIKRLTPEGQLGMLQKIVERGKTKGDKAYEGVELTQDMIDKILNTYGKDGSYDQAKLNEAVEDVKQQIADQMDVTKLDKVNAWRYLSMLGNPKTHIRNLVSNVAMKATAAVKNVVARTIEDIAPIKNRTKTWKAATDEVKAFAQKTTEEMKDVISDGGKYSEDASIKAKRAIFKNKILNGLYEFNSDMLTKEDWWFSKSAFNGALREYLTANGIRTKQDIQNNPKIIEQAKQYAMEQSQIATFRQYSWLANKINDIENRNTATSIAVGAILPFKKTPINIAKAGLNYSPIGFAKTLTYDISQVKKGKMEASELVDHLAQNITGSALTLAGYMLASSGLLSGGGDDDKEGNYDYQLGEQTYSVNIDGKSYSLSWLSPVAMPLFVGANAYEQLVEGKEWNGDVVVETLAQTLDPLSEMSFLSGLNQVLTSYDSGIEKFAGIGQSMAQNYATQFVPTLSSQIATVMDDTKRSTKVAGDSDFKFVDETINKLKFKIPGLRETLEPSTDIWGNEVKQTEDLITRAVETFIAPYSVKDNIATEIDAEIKSLYSAVGDNGLIPSVPDNYVKYKDEKHKMSAKEYTDFKKAYGQTAYKMLTDLFDTRTYQNASAEDRAEWVNAVYDYARDEAKKDFLAGKGVNYTNATKDKVEIYKENAIKGAIENDMTPDEYSFSVEYPEKYSFFNENGITYEDYASADEDGKRAYTWAAENPGKFKVAKAISNNVIEYRTLVSELYDLKADKDSNGKTISGSAKEKKIEYINKLNLDYGQKIILFKSLYEADDTYNYDIVEYLNSRRDISYAEMKTILEELGFTVHANGNVTW